MKKKNSKCRIPLDPKRKSLRCKPKGSTRPYTYAVRDNKGKVVRDEKGEIVHETIQIPMNYRERRAAAPSYKSWKKMQAMEKALKLMQHKIEKNKTKKEAKAAEEFKATAETQEV